MKSGDFSDLNMGDKREKGQYPAAQGRRDEYSQTKDGGVRVECYMNGALRYTKRCDTIQQAEEAARNYWKGRF